MNMLHRILASAALASAVFFACSNDKSNDPICFDDCDDNSSSSDYGTTSSSSGTSGGGSSSSGASSSSVYINDGTGCSYLPIWCGSITFDKVKKGSINDTDVGAQEKGQDRPNCIYAKEIIQIGNESGGISINGTSFATGSASRCGGDNGHGYGSTTPCATKFASVAKADGGYYIYVPAWAGQDFKTTGGDPICAGTGNPGNSSSSASGGGSTGGCVAPMYGLPPNGTSSCIKVGDKCYTCNPDRGSECSNAWIWQGNNVSEEYWYREVSCNEAGGGGGGSTNTLTCANLAQTGVAGTAITRPTVQCNGTNVTSTSITWTGAPANWNSPTTGTYNVSATANCGGNKTVSCGTLTVTAAPSTDQLACTGLAPTGVAGTAITQPTVRCGNTTVTTGITWAGAPTWNNPTANTYTVSATANCGGSSKTASCGSLTVNPKLACGNPSPATVTAGTAVTAPAVTCGSTTLSSSSISWSGLTSNWLWSNPTQGTYNSIKATANSGNCSGQTANCGSLTVNPKLTCNSVTQAITTGIAPTKPAVTCGTSSVTNGLSWSPTSINNVINTAQTISNVTVSASSGNCSGQSAACAGTITVSAPSSSSSGGGGSTYTPLSPGTQTAKTTQYWDACKPSCSWTNNAGGNKARACNITGTNIGSNDSDRSACDGGNAFACMNQAPWKVGSVSFGFAAINMGNCGDCYQLDFANGHVMVVKKNNIGNLNEGAAFDIMIPGGGVGDFDALTRQVTNSGINNPDMGVRYGGFRGQCNWTYSNSNVQCVRNKCNSVFANLPDLKAGCLWYADNLGTDEASWNNPTVRYRKLDSCPAELTNKY